MIWRQYEKLSIYTDYFTVSFFEQLLRNLLTQMFRIFKTYIIKYFDPKLEIDVNLSQLRYDYYQRSIERELYLKIKYADHEIPSYQSFLNEGRLSAIAVCMYLAALKIYPQVSDLKILYLDDVFIGLDTSNRMPLLKIIRDEFISDEFQVFISTYDRQWFKLAHQWFNNNNCIFKTLEMYIDDDGNPNTPEQPVLIDRSIGHFENAQRHYDAKDYPAAANYLRKACEAEIKRILPRNKKLKSNNDTGVVQEITKLETLINNFFEYATKNNLDCSSFSEFRTMKKIIFNPLSHDDLKAPHYRSEIQAGIDLVKCLRQIKIKEIVTAEDSAKKPMKLGVKDTVSGIMHQYEVTILENLRIVQQNTDPIKLSTVECTVNDGILKRPFLSLNEALNEIWKERSYTGQTDYTEFYKNITINGRKKLCDVMLF